MQPAPSFFRLCQIQRELRSLYGKYPLCAGDRSVSWASVESFGEGDYKEEELKAFAEERISQFNQSQGEEPAFENEKGAEKLPVALDTVSMKDGRAVLVTDTIPLPGWWSFHRT